MSGCMTVLVPSPLKLPSLTLPMHVHLASAYAAWILRDGVCRMDQRSHLCQCSRQFKQYARLRCLIKVQCLAYSMITSELDADRTEIHVSQCQVLPALIYDDILSPSQLSSAQYASGCCLLIRVVRSCSPGQQLLQVDHDVGR